MNFSRATKCPTDLFSKLVAPITLLDVIAYPIRNPGGSISVVGL